MTMAAARNYETAGPEDPSALSPARGQRARVATLLLSDIEGPTEVLALLSTLVGTLVGRSLVVARPADLRFELLQSLRAFARQHLAAHVS